ncbi:MAG: hypothetical protein ABWJ99_08065 [Caldimicrobium sp.]
MQERDSLLTLKDWIESFWQFQEEDLKFFSEDLKEKLSDPKVFIKELKNRMQTRRAYYRIFKYLSWRDVPSEDLPWVFQKLDEILARETIITNTIERVLEIFAEIFLEEDLKELRETGALIKEEKIIYH